MVAGREMETEIEQFVFLVVVGDGITTVDGVGRVGFHRIVQGDGDNASQGRYLRHLGLWRRDDDFLVGVFDLDDFVEFERDFVLVVMECPHRRVALLQYRRGLVFGASAGTSHVGTRETARPDSNDKGDGNTS